MWKFTLFAIGLVWTAGPLYAQTPLGDARREVLSLAEAGVPDTSAYLLANQRLAAAAVREGNLSLGRNATMILNDLAERFTAITGAQTAAAHLANARVTYLISRRHPTGIATANAALAAARRAGDEALAAEALYYRARFERGHRMPEARVGSLDSLVAITDGTAKLGRWHAHAALEQARDLKETDRFEEGLGAAKNALAHFDKFYPEERFLALDLIADIHGKLGDFGGKRLPTTTRRSKLTSRATRRTPRVFTARKPMTCKPSSTLPPC